MKSSLLLLASIIALVSATAFPARAATSGTEAQLARVLATTGQVAVHNVGDYVQVGSYRIWVESHLGQPDHRLANGTWLYSNRNVADTAVSGTLAVSFRNGRVADLKLISPAMAVALLHPSTGAMIAAR